MEGIREVKRLDEKVVGNTKSQAPQTPRDIVQEKLFMMKSMSPAQLKEYMNQNLKR